MSQRYEKQWLNIYAVTQILSLLTYDVAPFSVRGTHIVHMIPRFIKHIAFYPKVIINSSSLVLLLNATNCKPSDFFTQMLRSIILVNPIVDSSYIIKSKTQNMKVT